MEYSYGEKRMRRRIGRMLTSISYLWFTITRRLYRFNYFISKRLISYGDRLIEDSRSKTITVIAIRLLDRNIRRIKFSCDGINYFCYEHGDYKDVYKEYTDKEIPISLEDAMYVRHCEVWDKI